MRGEAPWVIGYLGTWFVLASAAEIQSLRPLVSAFAIAIALTATFVLGEKAAKNVTLGKV